MYNKDLFFSDVMKILLPEHSITSSRNWMEVRDVMSRDVTVVSSSDTLGSAAKIMSRRNISCIVVLDDGIVTGILTERDLLRKVAVKGVNFGKAKVLDAMSSPVECAASNFSILDCGRIMEEKRIRRLPVLEDGQLVGIVTQTDLTKALISYGMWRNVAEVMTGDTAVVQRKATVAEVAKIMSSRSISSVVVLNGDDVTGVITERDLLKKVVALQKNPVRISAEDVMSSPVFGVDPDYSIFSTSRIMERMNYRRLVVMEDKRLRGIITQTDIFRAVREKLEEGEEKNLDLLEKSEHGIYTVDLDGRTTYVNKALMELLGVSDSGELLSQSFLPERFWFNPEEGAQFVAELKEKGFIESKELTLVNSEGKKLYVSLSTIFTKNNHGEINGSQGVLHDISADKEIAALMEAKEALRESEERYRTLSQNIPVGLYRNSLGPEGKFIMANHALARMHGYDNVEELLETHIADLYEDPAQRQIISEKLLDQGEIVAEEVRLKKRDGTLIWGAVTARVVRDESGEVKWFDGMIEDTTERKRVEEELKTSGKRLHDIVLSSADWIWEVDKSGRYTYASGMVEQILGYSSDEIIGKTPFELMPEDEAERIGETFKGVVSEKKPIVDLENWNLTKEGKRVCLLTNGVPIQDEKGEFLGYRGVDKDITERKRAEEALRESEEKLSKFADLLPQIAFEMNGQGRLTFINRNGYKIFGYTQDDFDRGLDAIDMLIPEDHKRVKENIQRMMRGEQLGGTEYTAQKKDGSTFPVISHSNSVFHENKPVGIRGIIIDITEQKRYEDDLQKHNDELEAAKEMAENNAAELSKAFDQLNAAKQDLEGFNRATIGREMRIIEIKREVNELLTELDREPKYRITDPKVKV